MVFVEHFVRPGERRWGVMRHLMAEIAVLQTLSDPIPSTPEGLESAFRDWLWCVNLQRVIVVIDNVDLLLDDDDPVAWLPPKFPSTVQFVLTTSSEPTRDQFRARGWHHMNLEPLSPKERSTMLEHFISARSEAVVPGLMRPITGDPSGATPLLLHTAAGESNGSGVLPYIDPLIASSMAARSLDEFYTLTIERWECVHGVPIVRTVLGLLAASRYGVSGAELASLSGTESPAMHLLLDELRYDLIPHDENFVICHDALRDAVTERYAEDIVGVRTLFAEHLTRRLLGRSADRSTEIMAREAAELAYQLHSLGHLDRLRDLLVDIRVMVALATGDAQYEFLIYWRDLARHYDIEQEYRAGLAAYRATATETELLRALGALGAVAYNVGRWDFALELRDEEHHLALRTGRREQGTEAAGILGELSRQKGRHEAALGWYHRQLRLAEELGLQRQRSIALGHVGQLFAELGQFRESLEYHRQQLEVAESIRDRRQIVKATAGLAHAYDRLGDSANATVRYERILALAERTGDRRMMSYAANIMGTLYRAQGDYVSALGAHKRKLEIAEELGDPRQASIALGNIGLSYFELDDYDSAIEHYTRSLMLSESLGYSRQIVWAATNLGDISTARGLWDVAESHYAHAKAVVEEIGDESTLAYVIGHTGLMYALRGRLEEALELVEQALDRHGALGHRFGVALWLYQKAELMFARKFGPFPPQDIPRPSLSGPEQVSVAEETTLDAVLALLDDCMVASRESGRSDTQFDSRLLEAWVSCVRGDPDEALRRANMLANDVHTDAQRARWHLVVGQVRRARKHDRGAGVDLGEAYSLYRRLCARTGNALYRRLLNALELLVDSNGVVS